MRWEDERYVRVYTRDTPEWSILSWEARAVFYEILRKVDRAGVIPMGRSGYRGLAGLLRIPVDVVERAMGELLDDGCIESREASVVIPNFMEAQEARQSDRARQQASRERARAKAPEPTSKSETPNEASQNVTPTSQNVTECHTPSHPVTPSLAVPSLADPRSQIPPVSADQGSVTTRARPEPPSAHTPARATAVEPIPSALPAIASPENIAAMLAAEPALSALASEPRYADRIAGQLLASGITRDLAQRTIRDFALKRAHDGPDTRPEILAQALGGFFARARREGSAARESEPMAPEVRETLAAFDAAWSKAHGGQVRAHDARDPEHAAKLVELARDVAERSKGVDYRQILAHKTRGYLADREKLVMDSDHPLRLFASRFSAYGMPTGPTRPSGPKPEETQRRALTADEMAKVRAETPGMDRFLKPIARAS